VRTLLLMRHAKSSWDRAELEDHDRPLSKRGRRDARMMGALLRDQRLVPDLICVSTAVRARETVDLMVGELSHIATVLVLPELYGASADELVCQIARMPAEVERALLVAHNPGVGALVERLAGERQRMPTSAIAYLRMHIDTWPEILIAPRGDVVHLWRPRDLRPVTGP